MVFLRQEAKQGRKQSHSHNIKPCVDNKLSWVEIGVILMALTQADMSTAAVTSINSLYAATSLQ